KLDAADCQADLILIEIQRGHHVSARSHGAVWLAPIDHLPRTRKYHCVAREYYPALRAGRMVLPEHCRKGRHHAQRADHTSLVYRAVSLGAVLDHRDTAFGREL